MYETETFEEQESLRKFLEKEHEEAVKSYEGVPDSAMKYCHRCGRLMKYRSMAYDEGFHFDSCE